MVSLSTVSRHLERTPGRSASSSAACRSRQKLWSTSQLALGRAGQAGSLGTEPGPELRQLHQQVLSADPALAARRATGRAPHPAARPSGPRHPPLALRGRPGTNCGTGAHQPRTPRPAAGIRGSGSPAGPRPAAPARADRDRGFLRAAAGSRAARAAALWVCRPVFCTGLPRDS